MTIVSATDFSPAATDALAVAVEIAKKRSEKLLLWHAVQPQMGDVGDPYLEPLRADAIARLNVEADRIRRLGVDVSTETIVGWLDSELPGRIPPDTTLVVAGARGHARGTHWLIGSVVERLARVTTVPLLVVRDPAPLWHWLNGTRKLNVIVATDLSAVSDYALRRASLLRELAPCDVELLYIEYPPSEYARLGIAGPVCVHRPNAVIDEVLTRELEKRAESADFGGAVGTRIARTLSEAGALIAKEAGEAEADLVVIGSHQRRAVSRLWHGSIANGVLHSAETNVLLIPFHTSDEDLRALEEPPVKTVLAATDFSAAGNRAVAWALAMAHPDSRVVIATIASGEKERDEATREMERLGAALTSRDACIETMVATSKDVADEICAIGERIGADAVVIGRHGRSRLGRIILGSVAGEVLLRCRRPVLVVPDVA